MLNPSAGRFPCTQCGKVFNLPWSLKLHEKKEHTAQDSVNSGDIDQPDQPIDIHVFENLHRRFNNFRENKVYAGQGSVNSGDIDQPDQSIDICENPHRRFNNFRENKVYAGQDSVNSGDIDQPDQSIDICENPHRRFNNFRENKVYAGQDSVNSGDIDQHDKSTDKKEKLACEANVETKTTSNKYLLVVAFDLGTTYSGYAFSFRNDPLNVRTNRSWSSGSEKLISLKTPTCVLVNKNGEFSCFGFEAENKYLALAEDDKHHGWHLYRRFKMVLHNNKTLSRASTIKDIADQKTEALPIFAMAIRFLREHMLNAISTNKVGVLETDIHYVITVPAIWDDAANQFMREAAVEAGINSESLRFAREPEAASIWCEQINPGAKSTLSTPGTQVMVVDLGGGTADISVHQRMTGGVLKEIHGASGGPWGGICVDQNYTKTLAKVFGEKAMEDLRSDEMLDYFDLMREFEAKKRGFTSKLEEKVTFRIPSTLIKLSEKHKGKIIKDIFTTLGYGDQIVLKGGDKLRVEPAIVREWFDGPIDNVIKHITDLLAEPKMSSVNIILLVGGFGECQYVQERMKSEILKKHIILPEDAGLVVLKGAVRFGHEPDIVSSRIMKYSYGVSAVYKFDASRHPRSRTIIYRGIDIVTDAFVPFVHAGQEILINQDVTDDTFTLGKGNTSQVPIYRSISSDPIFVDEERCELLGTLTIIHDEIGATSFDGIDITFRFGDSELVVKVISTNTGKEKYLTLNCLK